MGPPRGTKGMLIEILVTKDCPHEDTAIDLVGMAANSLNVAPQVTVIEVADLTEATQRRFVGSPTIRVEGRDVSPPNDPDASLSCRLYKTTHGLSGVPDVSLVLAALKDSLDLKSR